MQRQDGFEKSSSVLLAIGIVYLLAVGLSSLTIFPLADSYRWWGDETWLMLEFRNQILTGKFAHPFAFGSSIHYSSGPILGSMWLSALLYGVPSALAPLSSIVTIGRAVSFSFAVLLLYCVYRILRSRDTTATIALFFLLLIASTKAFLFSSHAARYDMATSVWVISVLALTQRTVSTFLLGAIAAAGLLLSVHAMLLTAPMLGILILLKHRDVKEIARFVIGGVAVVALLLVVQLIVYGELSLFGGHHTTFTSNVSDIPLLRPFSRSVQIANLVQKIGWLYHSAPAVLFLTPITLSIFVLRTRKFTEDPLQQLVGFGAIIILSWLLLESAAPPSYVIYIIPVLCVMIAAGIIAIKERIGERLNRAVMPIASIIGGIALCVIGAIELHSATHTAIILKDAQQAAVTKATDLMRHDSAFAANDKVIVFNPAVHQLLGSMPGGLMTTHFIEFPASDATLGQTITNFHVHYILVFASAIKPDYMREVAPLLGYARTHGTLVLSEAGTFTDIGRDYWLSSLAQLDTLLLYRLP